MKQLDPSQFIRACLLEARLMPGTRVDFDGGTWEAVELNTGRNGWLWRLIAGKNPNKDKNIDTRFFEFPEDYNDSKPSIYKQPMFNQNVITGKQPAPRGGRFTTTVIPPEVDSPESAYRYAKRHPGWTDGEYLISKSPKWSFYYASFKGKPFVKGEYEIIKDPMYATTYAIAIMKRRWPDAEPIIKTDPLEWRSYVAHFPDAAR